MCTKFLIRNQLVQALPSRNNQLRQVLASILAQSLRINEPLEGPELLNVTDICATLLRTEQGPHDLVIGLPTNQGHTDEVVTPVAVHLLSKCLEVVLIPGTEPHGFL